MVSVGGVHSREMVYPYAPELSSTPTEFYENAKELVSLLGSPIIYTASKPITWRPSFGFWLRTIMLGVVSDVILTSIARLFYSGI
jgi:hypothetical protein